MDNGFIISKLVLTGINKPAARIDFTPGLNVISGPTNTGKSFIYECIDFLMGGKELPRDIVAARGYDLIFLELKQKQTTYTLERSKKGGELRLYETEVENIDGAQAKVLSSIHDKDSPDTVSAFLLKLNGLTGRKIRTDKVGTARTLSYRDVCHLLLISETEIIKKTSPILYSTAINKTAETNVVKFLVTGIDDSSIVPGVKKDVILSRKGKIEILKELIDELATEGDSDLVELDLRLQKMNETIKRLKDEQSQVFNEFSENDNQRKELSTRIHIAESRVVILNEILVRSVLLKETYISDIKRLNSTIEAGVLLRGDNNHSKICPYCKSEIEIQLHNSDIDKTVSSCEREIDKINALHAELEKSHDIITGEKISIETQIERDNGSLLRIEKHLDENLSNKLSKISSEFDAVTTGRNELLLKKQTANNLQNYVSTRDEIASSIPSRKKQPTFDSLTTAIMQPLCNRIADILTQYHQKELEGVTFSEKKLDLVIDGEDRSLEGKGMRAITYATFILGLVEFVNDKTYKLGVPIFDSPLITYSKPEAEGEGISEDLAMEFYKYCGEKSTCEQIIVLENIEPPDEIYQKINHIKFTGIDNTGRKGFIP